MQKYFYQAFILLFFYITPIQAQDKNFKEEEITFTNQENVFSGTLTIPQGREKSPAIILISDGGSQTRDVNMAGFPIFKTIAAYFASRGIAVLRYDDRNTGKTQGANISESSIQELAEDIVQAARFLAQRPEINNQK